MNKIDLKAGDNSARVQSRGGEMTASDFMKKQEGEQDVQEVIREATTSETSLRHLFYLEYKTNFPEGEQNPIVYSRFAK